MPLAHGALCLRMPYWMPSGMMWVSDQVNERSIARSNQEWPVPMEAHRIQLQCLSKLVFRGFQIGKQQYKTLASKFSQYLLFTLTSASAFREPNSWMPVVSFLVSLQRCVISDHEIAPVTLGSNQWINLSNKQGMLFRCLVIVRIFTFKYG